MTYHLFGNIITARGIAANDRGEIEGNAYYFTQGFLG